MKKLLFASLLAAAIVFAQTGGGTTDKKEGKLNETKTTVGKPKTHAKSGSKVASGKKAVKDKKGKKGSGGTTTPPPK